MNEEKKCILAPPLYHYIAKNYGIDKVYLVFNWSKEIAGHLKRKIYSPSSSFGSAIIFLNSNPSRDLIPDEVTSSSQLFYVLFHEVAHKVLNHKQSDKEAEEKEATQWALSKFRALEEHWDLDFWLGMDDDEQGEALSHLDLSTKS